MADSDDFDSRFDEGIRLFNEREFFASHDVWEDVWSELTGPEKRFVQGLIQAAVALFHFEERNHGGALKMHRSARVYLSSYGPECLGIAVAGLIDALDACFRELSMPHQSYPAHLSLDPRLIPVIHRKATHGSAGEGPNNEGPLCAE